MARFCDLTRNKNLGIDVNLTKVVDFIPLLEIEQLAGIFLILKNHFWRDELCSLLNRSKQLTCVLKSNALFLKLSLTVVDAPDTAILANAI